MKILSLIVMNLLVESTITHINFVRHIFSIAFILDTDDIFILRKEVMTHKQRSGCKKTFRCFCLLFIILTLIVAGCQTMTPTPAETPAWKTFKNQECAYEFQYPGEARVEIMDKNAGQLKVDVGIGKPNKEMQEIKTARQRILAGGVLWQSAS